MIPIIKKILFPTDLSENSRHAFYYAASLATRYGGSLIVLHVMEKLPTRSEHMLVQFVGEKRWQEMRREQEDDVRQVLIGKKNEYEMIRIALDKFCRAAGIDTEHCSFETQEVLIKTGETVEEIVATAREKKCDMVIMGTHGHKGLLESTALGSTARAVLEQSRIPVLIVPPPDTTAPQD